MTLTRRDAAATAFVLLAVATLLVALAGWNVPLVGDSYRWAAGAAFVFGFGGYLSGEPLEGNHEPMLGVLGIVALALGILAVATGSGIFLVLLVADIIVLWSVTTLHHSRRNARRGSIPSQV